MDDLVLTVKQIAQYPRAASVKRGDLFLIQQDATGGGAMGGPYASLDPYTLFSTALAAGGWLQLAPYPEGGLAFNGASLTFGAGAFNFSEAVRTPTLEANNITINGLPVADRPYVESLFAAVVANTVHSVNGRTGDVQLTTEDILRAGAAPIWSPHFGGHVTAPTSWNVYANDDTVATLAWVQQWACTSGLVVSSINGRGGAVTLNADDISIALSSTPGTYGFANTPPLGDASGRIATTLFVDNSNEDLRAWVTALFETHTEVMEHNFALLDSPNFVGVPTAPTANPGNNTGQLATTAFVQAAVTASTTGVASFNGRTGAVVLTSGDLVTAGAATLNSPAFTGTPSAPTPPPGTNNTALATTAFVDTAIAGISAGVTTWNGRSGAVTLAIADITGVGGAPIASPGFSGTPTAPTPAANDNTTKLATTAFVMAQLAALPAPVTSVNGRSGAVTLIGADISAAGGALTASPAFTGTPTAPTAIAGTSNTQIATTAFVQAAITGAVAGVTTWNGRSGAVTLSAADVTGVGGAMLASPTFTGTPAAPTATAGTNSTQLATTAFVQAALAAAPGGVSSFNTRTGAITLNSGDISAAGGALIASPTFTGNPAAPTQSPGTANSSLATTQFVATALATAGGVNSFNGRAGAVTLTAADLTGAGGALLAGPAFTGAPTAPTAALGTSTTQLATTAFVAAAIGAIPPPVTQSDTAPNVSGNQLWFDSVGGQLYVQYVDPITSAKSWVIANSPQPSPAPPPAAGTRVLLATTVVNPASPVATVDFPSVFSSAYDDYEIEWYGVGVSSGAGLTGAFMSAGSTVVTGANYYTYATMYANSNNSGAGGGGVGNYAFLGYTQSAGQNINADGRARLCLPWRNDVIKFITTIAQAYNSGVGVYTVQCTAFLNSNFSGQQTTPIVGIRFLLTAAGNITRGVFNVYGKVNGSALI